MVKKIAMICALAFSAVNIAWAQTNEEVMIVEMDNALDEVLVPAPDFTLKNIDGNPVSLSEFQGKWVVLDFWGSWCRYCIMGIPDMKATYSEYHPQGLEIIGIDCNETDEAWRAAVASYELPWINVYNPDGRNSVVTQEYKIQGYPTKIVVNPEGYIARTFLGEDPAFYAYIASLFSDKK